jgi:type II secretory pathway predicted ATPase ExeA
MYLEHFGLREAPFRITPHTEFFFAGANRGATLEALIYAITHDEGIVKVTGEVGSGKTMLCRMLLEKLPEQVETVYLANPSLSRDEILYAIAEEIDAPLPEGRIHLLLRTLQERLLEIYATGRQVVVLIDEAHAMPPETLEEIRLLSNLESNRHKLLHIVLFGQPELDDRLNEMNMRQLKERITHNFVLEPLHHSDIGGYLMFRIRAAGYHGPDLFTAAAIQLINRASEGLTRRINILADKALLAAFSDNSHQIDAQQVKAAVRDAQFRPMRDRRTAGPWLSWLGGALLLSVVAGAAYLYGTQKNTTEDPSPTPLPAAQTAPQTTVTPAPPSAITSAQKIEPIPETPNEKSAPPMAEAVPTESKIAVAPPAKSRTLAARITATDAWLKNVPDTHYFIQLLNIEASSQNDVNYFLDNEVNALDPQLIRVYRSSLKGQDRIGVIYGDYPTRESANKALMQLPKGSRPGKPYVRSVSKLR